jgi:hypothetical protein
MCTPRAYTVNFNLMGKGDGSKAESQDILYLTHINRPLAQY